MSLELSSHFQLLESKYIKRSKRFDLFEDELEYVHDRIQSEKAEAERIENSVSELQKSILVLRNKINYSSDKNLLRKVDSKFSSPIRSELDFPDYFTKTHEDHVEIQVSACSFATSFVTEDDDYIEEIDPKALEELRLFFNHCIEKKNQEKLRNRNLLMKFQLGIYSLNAISLILSIYFTI